MISEGVRKPTIRFHFSILRIEKYNNFSFCIYH